MSLLFKESPYIIAGITVAGIAGLALKSNVAIGCCIVLFLFMLYFYRHKAFNAGEAPDNVLLSPCEGKVLDVLDRHDYYYIPIFLSPFNRHTQIYPANCRVLSRTYDYTGKFKPVMNLDKSRYNEKKMHILQMNNGAVIKLTQIAGFLPRMITSSDALAEYKAGDYLGMIKFGSRVDLLLPKEALNGTKLELRISRGDRVSIGDFIGEYV